MVSQPVKEIAAAEIRHASLSASHARNEVLLVFMVLIVGFGLLRLKNHSWKTARRNKGFNRKPGRRAGKSACFF
jgi:hypothetical protein